LWREEVVTPSGLFLFGKRGHSMSSFGTCQVPSSRARK